MTKDDEDKSQIDMGVKRKVDASRQAFINGLNIVLY